MKLYHGDEVVVVTGSSQGIGETTALMAAEEGVAAVVVNGRRAEETEAVAAKIRTMGVRAAAYIGDLSEPGKATGLIDFAVGKFGRIDLLVNNVGVSDRSNLAELTAEEILRMMNINLIPAMLSTQAAVAAMRKLNIAGSIVCNGSMNGIVGQGNLVAYSATKAALANFIATAGHQIAVEHAGAFKSGNPLPWIRLNGVHTPWTYSPGETKYKRQENPDTPDDWWQNPPLGGVPRGVMTTVEEVARVFLMLGSPFFSHINAQNWQVEQFNLAGPPNRAV